MTESIHIGKNVYIAPTAILIGNVNISDGVSIFDNAVLRGDLNSIEIGENTNIQDNTTIHVEIDNPVKVGKNVSIGHNAVVHGAIIGDNVIIGMGSIVLNGAKIASGSIVGAGAVVTENFSSPENSLIVGIPAKVKRTGNEFLEKATMNGNGYQILRDLFLKNEYERFTKQK
ncbi:MAG: gamma carbonic anhydrase family protein [Thermoplasmataceae archaeon]